MKIIDISMKLHEGMVTWPGDPEVRIDWVAKIGEKSDANISALSFGLHTGTHIDVPLHFVEGGWNMNDLDLNVLIGKVEVVAIPDDVTIITRDVLESINIGYYERVIFKTSNSRFLGEGINQFQEDFVALGGCGADYLIEKGCQLVGIDYLSIAPYNNLKTTHVTLLEAGVVILEGLDLSNAEAGIYELICLPLRMDGREGASARAVLRKSA